MNEDGGSYEEKRLVCHSILEQRENRHIKLVAHVTRGCESGHVCLKFHRREKHVLELQQGSGLTEAPEDACADSTEPPYITLITAALKPTRCPIVGRYSVVSSLADRRLRRQQLAIEGESQEGRPAAADECVAGDFDSVQVGCGAAQDTMEFKSACASTVYTCHGSWRDGSLGLLVAAPVARSSSHPRALCFMYTHRPDNGECGRVGRRGLSLLCVDRTPPPT
ncbi:hypothetical protein EVAR_81942_1 [Eumeta japonica]|uniref:DUF7043 domain-containing protein n=1 Tax=Eumeta variegata TaxID=151549 RepID=A0A4C1ZGV5_EUMVA|nr:hypothetical protein EVAR_81942_1 [Eumeta japonica]